MLLSECNERLLLEHLSLFRKVQPDRYDMNSFLQVIKIKGWLWVVSFKSVVVLFGLGYHGCVRHNALKL